MANRRVRLTRHKAATANGAAGRMAYLRWILFLATLGAIMVFQTTTSRINFQSWTEAATVLPDSSILLGGASSSSSSSSSSTTAVDSSQQQQGQHRSLLRGTDSQQEQQNDSHSNSHHMAFKSPDASHRIAHFRDTALKFEPITDKIGVHSEHRYHNMYGQYLLPYVATKPRMKFLEIGLGCNMEYGAGASVKVWKDLFPEADLWEAEYDGECVQKAKAKGQLDGLHPLVGDQADEGVLNQWIQESGGKFDIIIDDGGHSNCQMSNSFDKLWPELLPGGLYFIEDLHVSRARPRCNDALMTERILEWNEQLMYLTNSLGFKWKHKLPSDVLFVSCQAEACVIAKKKSEAINDPYKPHKRDV
ncbi:2'-O-methyltransferase [Seminavis robusta]|uniref:2'-O-methyltransferase n=1 Tax=Seminavis robusta TaxID=568900 RepID=A0A9N8DLW6_9STRA|nr:2'-O-methyltransferase [Seminavis robusta]|eukprot:Sro154_g069950.1 2'-O-methyltransferase (361) ;mRNA; f:32088-33293